MAGRKRKTPEVVPAGKDISQFFLKSNTTEIPALNVATKKQKAPQNAHQSKVKTTPNENLPNQATSHAKQQVPQSRGTNNAPIHQSHLEYVLKLTPTQLLKHPISEASQLVLTDAQALVRSIKQTIVPQSPTPSRNDIIYDTLSKQLGFVPPNDPKRTSEQMQGTVTNKLKSTFVPKTTDEFVSYLQGLEKPIVNTTVIHRPLFPKNVSLLGNKGVTLEKSERKGSTSRGTPKKTGKSKMPLKDSEAAANLCLLKFGSTPAVPASTPNKKRASKAKSKAKPPSPPPPSFSLAQLTPNSKISFSALVASPHLPSVPRPIPPSNSTPPRMLGALKPPVPVSPTARTLPPSSNIQTQGILPSTAKSPLVNMQRPNNTTIPPYTSPTHSHLSSHPTNPSPRNPALVRSLFSNNATPGDTPAFSITMPTRPRPFAPPSAPVIKLAPLSSQPLISPQKISTTPTATTPSMSTHPIILSPTPIQSPVKQPTPSPPTSTNHTPVPIIKVNATIPTLNTSLTKPDNYTRAVTANNNNTDSDEESGFELEIIED